MVGHHFNFSLILYVYFSLLVFAYFFCFTSCCFVFVLFFVFLFLILPSYLFSFLEREAARDEILPTSSDNSASLGNKKRAPFKRLDRRE